jgi:DCN1-like protein 1/2
LLSKKSASFDPLVPEINAVFNKYKDHEDPNDLGIEGTIAFVQDLGVDLEDPVTLALAYKLYSPRLGSFPRSLFILGWVELG